MPLLYALLLSLCRRDVVERRPSRLSRAAAFLWRDYADEFVWWELVDLLRRLTLTGTRSPMPPPYAHAPPLASQPRAPPAAPPSLQSLGVVWPDRITDRMTDRLRRPVSKGFVLLPEIFLNEAMGKTEFR